MLKFEFEALQSGLREVVWLHITVVAYFHMNWASHNDNIPKAYDQWPGFAHSYSHSVLRAATNNDFTVFQEKIKTTPLTICFTDYTGAQEYHPCIQYMARKFKEQKKSGPQAYCHLTCLTDTNNMRFVINAVTDLLIKNFLKDCGIYWMNQMYTIFAQENTMNYISKF